MFDDWRRNGIWFGYVAKTISSTKLIHTVSIYRLLLSRTRRWRHSERELLEEKIPESSVNKNQLATSYNACFGIFYNNFGHSLAKNIATLIEIPSSNSPSIWWQSNIGRTPWRYDYRPSWRSGCFQSECACLWFEVEWSYFRSCWRQRSVGWIIPIQFRHDLDPKLFF